MTTLSVIDTMNKSGILISGWKSSKSHVLASCWLAYRFIQNNFKSQASHATDVLWFPSTYWSIFRVGIFGIAKAAHDRLVMIVTFSMSRWRLTRIVQFRMQIRSPLSPHPINVSSFILVDVLYGLPPLWCKISVVIHARGREANSDIWFKTNQKGTKHNGLLTGADKTN